MQSIHDCVDIVMLSGMLHPTKITPLGGTTCGEMLGTAEYSVMLYKPISKTF